jgi:hypothetical protein
VGEIACDAEKTRKASGGDFAHAHDGEIVTRGHCAHAAEIFLSAERAQRPPYGAAVRYGDLQSRLICAP